MVEAGGKLQLCDAVLGKLCSFRGIRKWKRWSLKGVRTIKAGGNLMPIKTKGTRIPHERDCISKVDFLQIDWESVKPFPNHQDVSGVR